MSVSQAEYVQRRPSKMPHIPVLDGVRGVAIILVLIYHFIYCQTDIAIPGTIYGKVVGATAWMHAGVDLFFVLSGFLVGGIALANKDAKNFASVFLIKRACRILPAYFILLLAYGAARVLFTKDIQLSQYLACKYSFFFYPALAQNIAMGIDGSFGPEFLAPTWSLAVEDQFYLLLVCLTVILRSHRSLFIFTLFGISIAPILRYFNNGITSDVNMPFRMDSLLWGVLLAFIYKTDIFPSLAKNRHLTLIRALMYIASALLMFLAIRNYVFYIFDQKFIFGLSFFLFCAALVFESTLNATPAWHIPFRNRLLIYFGWISYSLYLYHMPLQGGLFWGIYHAEPSYKLSGSVHITILALISAIALSSISRQTIEEFFLKRGRLLKYRLT